MGSWLLPSAAVSFAVGILAWTWAPPRAEPWLLLAVGLGALAAGWVLAATGRRGAEPLALAGLVRPQGAAADAVAAERIASPGASVAVAVAVLLGLACLGAGWSG